MQKEIGDLVDLLKKANEQAQQEKQNAEKTDKDLEHAYKLLHENQI